MNIPDEMDKFAKAHPEATADDFEEFEALLIERLEESCDEPEPVEYSEHDLMMHERHQMGIFY